MSPRPVKYKTVEDLQSQIDEYFESCWVDKVIETENKDTGEITTTNVRYQNRPYTVTGLALHLNLTRQGLLEYQHKSKAFSDTITRAKLKVEMYAEESLFTAKNTNGVAFALKNNFKWVDKQDLNHSGEMTVVRITSNVKD